MQKTKNCFKQMFFTTC